MAFGDQTQTGISTPRQPRLGIQGPVVAWQDPWAGEGSDAIMRTGTGVAIPSQDPPAAPAMFVAALRDLGADFYVHHVIPIEHDHGPLFHDLSAAGIDVVLGNEYGNINGPHVAGTNRYDIPAEIIQQAADAGRLAGVLYDEPEHLQIHADQYRRDAFLPHFGDTTGATASEAIATIHTAIQGIVRDVENAVTEGGAPEVPVFAEQVFPVMFHTFARAGMTPCPKVMKESFQPLQLSTALGASLQYRRQFWICADLWGPDIGPWFTRAPGFPGHSPAEFASALRLAYLFAPTGLFVENVDVLLQHSEEGFADTEFGAVWREFVREFVPAHPLHWRFDEARADIVLIHAEDSDFGRGHQPFGNRLATAPESSKSVFEAWHVLSHGTIPSTGSCMHIPGYDFPRHELNSIPRSDFPLAAGAPHATRTHGLFHAARNVLVFDEHVRDDQLGMPELIIAAGSRLPETTLALLRSRAEAGATVVLASWLAGPVWTQSRRIGSGHWIVSDDLDDDDAQHAVEPHLGRPDVWTQRFGSTELHITPGDADGVTLDFEIHNE